MEEIIFDRRSFNNSDLNHIDTDYLKNYPIVYVLYNDNKRPLAYIGQSVQVERRMKNHLKNSKRNVFKNTVLIGHKEFNQSATYNIESNLINYFIAENRYKLQNVSQTIEYQTHNYHQKEYYNEEIFNQIWEKLLEEKMVTNKIEDLKNKDIFKLSPYTALSEKQLDIKNKILTFCKANIQQNNHYVFLITGDAGTGKSVVLSSLFNSIQDHANEESSILANTNNFLLVNHEEMIKTYRSIASSLPNLKKKNFMKPTPFINKMDKTQDIADIVLVDESHLLLSKQDKYNYFHYENQLEEIIKRSKITVIIFDPKQVLKLKSYWNTETMNQIVNKYPGECFTLKDQFRINGGGKTTNWIDNFVNKRLNPIPNGKDEKFELKVFENSEDLKNTIEEKDEKFGLSRIVSTFDFLHKKDNNTYFVDQSGLNMPWNTTNNTKAWAEENYTIKEVGSTYTVQGFDLNYVGVILGPSISYDFENECILIDSSQYKDTEAYRARKDLSLDEIEKIKEEIILNSINILMKRGIRGLYIYATDPLLRKKLLSLEKE